MKAWMDWAARCGEQLVDLGQPLANGMSLNANGSENVQSSVAGFSVIQAENIEAAEALMQGHPHLSWNAACTIELHEAQPIPGM